MNILSQCLQVFPSCDHSKQMSKARLSVFFSLWHSSTDSLTGLLKKKIWKQKKKLLFNKCIYLSLGDFAYDFTFLTYFTVSQVIENPYQYFSNTEESRGLRWEECCSWGTVWGEERNRERGRHDRTHWSFAAPCPWLTQTGSPPPLAPSRNHSAAMR